jgi:thymidylate synthase (FAD)
MKIKLVSYSQPSKEMINEGIEDCQDLISFCARVSNPTNQLNTVTSEKLIKYLIKNSHWSPMELVNVCLEIRSEERV